MAEKALALYELKALVPSAGKKALTVFQSLELTEREVREVSVICKEYHVIPHTVGSLMEREDLKLAQVTDLVLLHNEYGNFASYRQLARAYKLCGEDIEVLSYFLQSAEDYVLCVEIPAKRFVYLMRVTERKYGGDPGLVAQILNDNNAEQAHDLFRGKLPWPNNEENEEEE